MLNKIYHNTAAFDFLFVHSIQKRVVYPVFFPILFLQTEEKKSNYFVGLNKCISTYSSTFLTCFFHCSAVYIFIVSSACCCADFAVPSLFLHRTEVFISFHTYSIGFKSQLYGGSLKKRKFVMLFV